MNVLYPEKSIISPKINVVKAGLIKPVFWLVFGLNYLYLNRLFIVATQDKFRPGVLVLVVSIGVILINLNIRRNMPLTMATAGLVGISVISAIINNTPFLQLIAFIRIPIVLYLVYNLVSAYVTSRSRAKIVLKLSYIIAVFQIPIILLQRWSYDKVPDWFRMRLSLVDFGMGTFNGDTSMAFMLIGLVILLLFAWPHVHFMRYRWLLSGWLSVAVLISNSQIQQITIILVWIVYLVIHFGGRAFLLSLAGVTLAAGFWLFSQYGEGSQAAPTANAIQKIAEVRAIFQDYMEYELFFEGRHAREQALHYYTHQPLKWIGDGPGAVYDTATNRHILGGWGHVFTFYAEVGLIGLLLSYLVFFVIAFPMWLKPGKLLIQADWVAALMFLSLVLVSIVKYPMGDTNQVFSYCLILIIHRVLMNRQPSTSGRDIAPLKMPTGIHGEVP